MQAEYAHIPGVVGTAKSAQILGVGSSWGMTAVSENKLDSLTFFINYVDENYISLHEFDLVSGAGFTSVPGIKESPREVVVNRKFVQEMGLGNDDDAVNESIWFQGNKLTIVGVSRGFGQFIHYS